MRRVLIARCFLAGLWLAAGAGPGAAAELLGRVEVVSKGGREVPGQAAQTVVWFEPDRPVPVTPAGIPEMITRRKEFTPRILVAERGATVAFPNRDPILHNVFSVSRGNAFDLGLLGEGPGAEAVLEQPGLVRIYCNVHHGMVAYVMVVDTPHYASPDAAGRFRLAGLPAGPGKLTAWHEQTDPATLELTLPAPGPVEVELGVSRPRVPRHLNKLGKSYGRGRDRY
jgi:hypothetical protein